MNNFVLTITFVINVSMLPRIEICSRVGSCKHVLNSWTSTLNAWASMLGWSWHYKWGGCNKFIWMYFIKVIFVQLLNLPPPLSKKLKIKNTKMMELLYMHSLYICNHKVYITYIAMYVNISPSMIYMLNSSQIGRINLYSLWNQYSFWCVVH